jgi:hypothetical protein
LIAYLDSSVVLRIVLQQHAPLSEWDELHAGVASRLLALECHRTLDRLWMQGRVPQEKLAGTSVAISAMMTRIHLRPIDDRVLTLASRPLPVVLGTLDAVHLATAMLFRDAQPRDERPIVFATHDLELARAARAMHFDVIGTSA